MAKLHDKISGTFTSINHAHAFCALRSNIQTGRQQAQNTLDTLSHHRRLATPTRLTTCLVTSGVPVAWYYPAALGNPALMDRVPHPEYGNTLTPRQYQQNWLETYRQLAGGTLPIDGCDLAGGGGATGIGGEVPADIAPVIAYAYAQLGSRTCGAEPAPMSSTAPAAYAYPQLGKPYVWRGAGPDVFDCSGFTLRAYQQIGIKLPHQSAAQARYGRAIDWRAEPIQPGALIFHRGSIPVHDNGHVGIAVSATHWIVAPKSGDVVSLRPIPFDRFKVPGGWPPNR